MSPLILSFPVMYAVVGFCWPATISAKVSLEVVIVTSASPVALGDGQAAVAHVDEPLALAVDVEEIRVADTGQLVRIRARGQAVEELLGCHRWLLASRA